MKTQILKYYYLLLPIALLSACANEEPISAKDEYATISKDDDTLNVCPNPNYNPEEVTTYRSQPGSPENDPDREIKDLGTSIVVNSFFTSKDTLFNFMNLVYSNIDAALADYRKNLNLEDGAISFLFKGGNVLRMIAHRVFDLLPDEARDFLQEKYSEYFKRSDADFTVYIDESKLNGNDYDTVFNEVADLIMKELSKIRETLEANPKKYFNFFKLDSSNAQQKLHEYLDELNESNSVKNADNDNWFQARFRQLQILDAKANPEPNCSFHGQYDYRMVPLGDDTEENVKSVRLTNKPDWIANSDNRTIEFPWGSDPAKTVKFFLVRSKVAFEIVVEKNSEVIRKPLLGELIDVSMTRKEDSALREFLDNYDKNIASYALTSKDTDEKLTLKAYSLHYLASDLQGILFDSFLRPWMGGPKYNKRVNRLFFLYIIDMLAQFGLGSSQISDYVAEVKDKIIKPLQSLYPISDSSVDTVTQLKADVDAIKSKWESMVMSNEFWQTLADFAANRLISAPREDDQEKFSGFLDTILKNLDNASRLSNMSPAMKIDLKEIYNVDMENLL